MRILSIACFCLFFIGCKSNASKVSTDIVESKSENVALDSVTKQSNDSKNNQIGKWKIHGNEPFWAINISNDSILFTKLNDKIDSVYFTLKDFSVENKLININIEDNKHRNAKLVLEFKENKCSDGMSDKQYEYSAVFTYDTLLLNGCAEKQ